MKAKDNKEDKSIIIEKIVRLAVSDVEPKICSNEKRPYFVRIDATNKNLLYVTRAWRDKEDGGWEEYHPFSYIYYYNAV